MEGRFVITIQRLTRSSAPAATILIRILVGAVFFSEGIQKFLFSDALAFNSLLNDELRFTVKPSGYSRMALSVSGTSRLSFQRYNSPMAIARAGILASIRKWTAVHRCTKRSVAMPPEYSW